MALSFCKKAALLHGTTSKHKGDFYGLNCLHSFRTETKPKFHEKLWKNLQIKQELTKCES